MSLHGRAGLAWVSLDWPEWIRKVMIDTTARRPTAGIHTVFDGENITNITNMAQRYWRTTMISEPEDTCGGRLEQVHIANERFPAYMEKELNEVNWNSDASMTWQAQLTPSDTDVCKGKAQIIGMYVREMELLGTVLKDYRRTEGTIFFTRIPLPMVHK